ncbi:MAG: M23 family metallopeptidase [Bacillota bacterium]
MPIYFNWKKIWKGGGGKSGLQRYYIIAGTYLLVIVVVFSLLVLRWGRTPPLDLPKTQMPVPELPFAAEKIVPDGVGETTTRESEMPQSEKQPVETGGMDREADDTDIPSAGGTPAAAPDTAGTAAETATFVLPPLHGSAGRAGPAEKPDLPAAAHPLPRWELYTPFSQYRSTTLPSGGSVHHLSRGVLLQATPAAPVSALWDGVVTGVTVMQGLYRCSVLVEHDAGYSTYYGNLREVWVKEGNFVSRGENIGLMPFSSRGSGTSPMPEGERPAEIQVESGENELSLPVSGNIPAGGRSAKIRTIWSGPVSEFAQRGESTAPPPQETMPALLPPGERESLTPENPILYLEVRHNSNYLDPLNFIRARN